MKKKYAVGEDPFIWGNLSWYQDSLFLLAPSFRYPSCPWCAWSCAFCGWCYRMGGWQFHGSSYIQSPFSNFRSNQCNMITWQTCNKNQNNTSELISMHTSKHLILMWLITTNLHRFGNLFVLDRTLTQGIKSRSVFPVHPGSFLKGYGDGHSISLIWWDQLRTGVGLDLHQVRWVSVSHLNSSKESSISSDIASFNKSPKGCDDMGKCGKGCCCWSLPRDTPQLLSLWHRSLSFPHLKEGHLERSLVLDCTRPFALKSAVWSP